MGQRQAYFGITKFKEAATGVMVPLNYDHWKPLILYFALRSTAFRVDCWSTEIEAISSIKPFADSVDVQNNENQDLVLSLTEALIDLFPDWTISENVNPGDSGMVLLSGEITNKIINVLINNCFDRCGRIKWFSIFFMDNGKITFSAEHYGTEFHATDIDDNDIAFIRSILPGDAIFHIFD